MNPRKYLPGLNFPPPLGIFKGASNWPWYQWILSNYRGAFTTLEPLAGLNDRQFYTYNISAIKKDNKLLNITINKQLAKAIVPKAEVCLQAPYLFLLTNGSQNISSLDCNGT